MNAQASYTASLHCIQGSQGQLYYISVTGQFDTQNGRRTEFPKTNPSYRTIPVSVDLGRQLICAIGANAKDDNILLIPDVQSIGWRSLGVQLAAPAAFQDYTSKVISGVLREEEEFCALYQMNVPTHSPPKNKTSLCGQWRPVTLCEGTSVHGCTVGGVSTQELYQQMGHAMKTIDRHSMRPRENTSSELYAMCLQKYVRSTVFSPARHLRYKRSAANIPIPKFRPAPLNFHCLRMAPTKSPSRIPSPKIKFLVATNNLAGRQCVTKESLPARSELPGISGQRRIYWQFKANTIRFGRRKIT